MSVSRKWTITHVSVFLCVLPQLPGSPTPFCRPSLLCTACSWRANTQWRASPYHADPCSEVRITSPTAQHSHHNGGSCSKNFHSVPSKSTAVS